MGLARLALTAAAKSGVGRLATDRRLACRRRDRKSWRPRRHLQVGGFRTSPSILKRARLHGLLEFRISKTDRLWHGEINAASIIASSRKMLRIFIGMQRLSRNMGVLFHCFGWSEGAKVDSWLRNRAPRAPAFPLRPDIIMAFSNVRAASWDYPIDRTRVSIVAFIFLIVFRFFAGAVLPVYYHDEIYYWLWSRHLAAGYYDHPPALAFVIRAGTALFGETAFGVRCMAIAAVSAASLCVWRTAALLLGRREDGVRAALFFNLMLMPTISAIPLFPDAPELACCAGFMWALAELAAGGLGWWWLIAGAFAGLGLLSKYTMFFFGAGAVVWLLLVKDARTWLKTVWPWSGGLLAPDPVPSRPRLERPAWLGDVRSAIRPHLTGPPQVVGTCRRLSVARSCAPLRSFCSSRCVASGGNAKRPESRCSPPLWDRAFFISQSIRCTTMCP